MLGALWFLQRRISRAGAQRREGESITVVGRRALGSKAQLVVVETADARYVLGVGEQGVTVIDRLERAPEAAPAPTSSSAAGPDAFERILAGTAPALDEPSAHHAPPASRPSGPAEPDADRIPRLRVRERRDPLHGSILSPQTWRQTAAALRRVR